VVESITRAVRQEVSHAGRLRQHHRGVPSSPRDDRQIGKELAAALKAEAKRRADSGAFFGYMAYASMIGRKPR
jgi:hypothetical protein